MTDKSAFFFLVASRMQLPLLLLPLPFFADFGVKDKKVSFGAIFGLFKFLQVVQRAERVMAVTQKDAIGT